MGRLLFCNNKDWNNRLKTIFQKKGLVKSYTDGLITSYLKRYVKNDNCIERGDNCLIITGTWAYDTDSDNMLEAVYQDLFIENHDLKYVRNKMIGSYCISFKKNDILKIAVDETHTYALYYYISDVGVVVTNTYFHIQLVANEELNRESFVIKLAKTGYNSNLTPFNNIYRLHEDDVLEFNYTNGLCKVSKLEINELTYDFKNEKEALDVLFSRVEKEAKMYEKLDTKKFLFLSGGLDSRVRLAIDLKFSRNVMLGYWKGTDSVTNGTVGDEKVNLMIADHEGLDTKIFEVGKSYASCMEDISKEEVDIFGEYISIYAHNKKWLGIFDYLNSIGIQEVQFGYDPDILKDLEYINGSYHENYTIFDLVHDASLRSGIFKRVFECSEVVRLTANEIMLKHHIDKNIVLSKEKSSNIFNYSRLDQGTSLINFMQESFYCCPLLYSRKIWEIVMSIPYANKADNKIPVAILERFYPDLLKQPFYTQRHYAYYNSRTKTVQSNKKYLILKKIQPYVINTKLYSILYTHFLEPKIYSHNRGNDELFKTSIDYLKKSKLLPQSGVNLREELDHKGFDLAGLCCTAAYIKAIEFICRNESDTVN